MVHFCMNGTSRRMWNGMEQTWVGMQSGMVSFPVHTLLLMISIWEGLSPGGGGVLSFYLHT